MFQTTNQNIHMCHGLFSWAAMALFSGNCHQSISKGFRNGDTIQKSMFNGLV